jgi:hypothetical protein
LLLEPFEDSFFKCLSMGCWLGELFFMSFGYL